jgi:hypothetical protein
MKSFRLCEHLLQTGGVFQGRLAAAKARGVRLGNPSGARALTGKLVRRQANCGFSQGERASPCGEPAGHRG